MQKDLLEGWKVVRERSCGAGCLDLMYIEDLKSRKEGLEFLDAIGKGKHLESTKCRLEKVAALIIDPLSPGNHLSDTPDSLVFFAVCLLNT